MGKSFNRPSMALAVHIPFLFLILQLQYERVDSLNYSSPFHHMNINSFQAAK